MLQVHPICEVSFKNFAEFFVLSYRILSIKYKNDGNIEFLVATKRKYTL